MFDLFRSRDTAVRIVLGGLLGLVALSMLLYLIPGAGLTGSSGASGGEVVAEIGNQTITTRDVQRVIQDKLRNRQMPPDMMQFLAPQLVDQAIADNAIVYEAKRLGLDVSDADLAYTIRTLPNFSSLTPDQYRMAVESMGQTVPEFESNIRKGIYDLRVQDIVLAGIVVTPKEVDQEFHKRNDKIKIQYIAFDPNKIKTEVKATPQEMQAFFTTMRGAFSMPETRNVALVVADPARIASQMQVSDAQIQQYYDAHKDQFRTPERVHARHILLLTTGKSKEQVDKIKQQAEDLLKQVKGGANFAELAKKYSEDPGSKDKGGDLGFFVRGQMVKNFENAAFSLNPNEISNVIQTEYGFHIVQVLEKQTAHLQTLSEVKDQIAGELKKGSVNDRVQNVADQARAEIAKAPQNAEQIATKLGLDYGKADKIKNGDPLPVIGVDKAADDTIFSLKNGEVSSVIQAGNRLVVAIVTAVNPPRPAEFAEVESQVRDRYNMQQAQKIVADRSKQAADMLKANGGDLSAVAKKFGLEVKTSDFFTRQGAVEGIGSANYFLDAFNKNPGDLLGAVNAGTMTVVGKLADKQSADATKLAGERDAILLQIKQRKAEESAALFQDSILTKLTQEKKVKIHRDVINRIIQSYRG